MPLNLTPPAKEASPERELSVLIWGASGSLATWGTRGEGRAFFLPPGPLSYLLSVLEPPWPLQIAAVTTRPLTGPSSPPGSPSSPPTPPPRLGARAHCCYLLNPALPISGSLPPTLPPGGSQVVPISNDTRRCWDSREEDWAGLQMEAGKVKWGLARGQLGAQVSHSNQAQVPAMSAEVGRSAPSGENCWH